MNSTEGSRPCRCVSARLFPHRANKCTLLNTNKAGKAVVAAQSAMLSAAMHPAGDGSYGRSGTGARGGDEGKEGKAGLEAVQLTGSYLCSVLCFLCYS